MISELICLLFCTTIQINEPVLPEPREERTIHEEDAEGSTTSRLHHSSGGVESDRDKLEISRRTRDNNVFRGYISSYSATWGGCLGCQKYFDDKGQLYYIMANGKKLDDSAYTIAFYDLSLIPLGTRVSLVNTTNGFSAAADVTDTGGFMECCNRIADVTPAVMNALDAKTDQDIIEIQILE